MKIFYGICGEGMGHCGRSIAMIERLVELKHDVRIFTSGEAYQLLTASGYSPHRIESLRFYQRPDGAVDILRTARAFRDFLARRHEAIDRIQQLALAERPDLFITDFEPLTALVADTLRAECVSIDNQHRFCHPLERGFPLHLRIYSRLAGEFVQYWIKRPRQCIVAVFHRCPASGQYRHVQALIRRRVAGLQPTHGDHVLVYARAGLGRRIAAAAAAARAPFVVYGCQGPPSANLEYRALSNDQFAADLASCRAVICSGGQQLIGEASFFGKPLLVVPIPKQHEQAINARYARREGIGDYCSIARLTSARIEEFLDTPRAERRRGNGVDQVLAHLGIGHG